jgi:pimeloyl-ACP methyl ester carboxylesterase
MVVKGLLVAGMVLCMTFPAMASETVIILHGIARSSASMKPVQKMLEESGYQVVSIDYPSTTLSLDGIADALHNNQLSADFWQQAEKVHFVTHSMGGLTARRYLQKFHKDIPAGKLGRVVMLAPPNGGSEVADLLQGLWPYRWYYGPAGQELTTQAQGSIHDTVYYELGIIAGTKRWPYLVSALVVPGISDGRVSIERTKLAGMKDHICVDGTHTFLMDRTDTQAQILNFLKNGAFDHGQ